MIEVKRVEIRDRATMIPAIALQVTGGDEDPLLWRAGYGQQPNVVLIHLEGDVSHNDPYHWPVERGRTMRVAHHFLLENWGRFRDGGILDVEYLLGETTTQKMSEVRP